MKLIQKYGIKFLPSVIVTGKNELDTKEGVTSAKEGTKMISRTEMTAEEWAEFMAARKRKSEDYMSAYCSYKFQKDPEKFIKEHPGWFNDEAAI